MFQELGSFPICLRKNRYKWGNIHSQLRYRASEIPMIGILTPEGVYSVDQIINTLAGVRKLASFRTQSIFLIKISSHKEKQI